MHNGSSNNLYYALEGFKTMLIPMRANIEILEQWFKNSNNPVKDSGYTHVMLAYLTLAERMTRTYKKPEFNINECIIDGTSYVVKEKTVATKTFCQLKHFSKIGIKQEMPKLLIIAPMSGHHATLLRDTVTEMLPYADVYITDWLDASTIPNQLGK